MKISVREESEDAQFIRKFSFDPKDLPIEEVFAEEVDYRLDLWRLSFKPLSIMQDDDGVSCR